MEFKDHKAMRFLELICSITKKEYELFIDFENRYEHQHTIRSKLINIVLNTKQLRKTKDVKLKDEILKNVQIIQNLIPGSFRNVLGYQNEDREKLIELLKQEEDPIAQEKLYLETNFNKLRKEILETPTEESEARKKARNMMMDYKDILMKQGILSNAADHLEDLLRKLPRILINQQRHLQK